MPVLVLGRNVTALGVIRSLGRAGVPTYSVCTGHDFAGRSRWARRLPARIPNDCSVAELTAILLALPFERLVLMPCSDSWARKVAALDPALSARFPHFGTPVDAVEQLTDKQKFADLARAHGIPHPLTLQLDIPEVLDELPFSPGAGYFIKARDSQALTTLLGVKGFQISSVDDAHRRVLEANAVGQGVVLQEYIPGPPTAHFFLDCFVDRDGVMRARFARQRLRMHPLPFGNSTYMRSISLDEVPDIVQTVDRLVAAAGLRGIFSVELKRDPRDGVAKVLDVNVRPWWFVEFASVCGVNVCEMAYRAALDEPIGRARNYDVGRTCVFPYYDAGACRRLRRAGELTLAAWIRSWLQSKHTVFSFDDPLPFVHCHAMLLLGMVRGARRRILRKLPRLLATEVWPRHAPVRGHHVP